MADQTGNTTNQIAAQINSNLEISLAAMQKYLNATQKCASVSQKMNTASTGLIAAMSGKIDFGVSLDVKKSFQKYLESNQKISGVSKGILEAVSGNIDFGFNLDLKKSLQKYNDLNKNIKGSAKGLLEAVSGKFDFGMNFDFQKIFQKGSGLNGMLAGALKGSLNLAVGGQKKDGKTNSLSAGLSMAGGIFANIQGMMGDQGNDPVKGMSDRWSKFTPIISGVSSALKNNKEAMMAVNTAEKAGMIVNSLSQGWGSASVALKMMQNGNTVAASAQMTLNSSMLACPATWIVAGIVALVAAGYLLIKNWDKVKVFLTNLWNGIKTTFSNALNFIWKLFDNKYVQAALMIFAPFIGLPVVVAKNWDKIKAFFSNLWNGIKAEFAGAVNWISNLVMGFWNKFKAVFDAVGGFFAKIFGGKNSKATLEIQTAAKTANANVSKHATGTSFHAGGLAMVGEEGPELVNLPRGSQVFSNSRTQSLLNGMGNGSAGISVNYSPQIVIQGNADAHVMKTASDNSYADFERKFNALMDRRRRLSFAGGL